MSWILDTKLKGAVLLIDFILKLMPTPLIKANHSNKLYIMDARPKINTIANKLLIYSEPPEEAV